MLSPKENISLTGAYANRSKKKGITLSNIFTEFSKVDRVIYILDTICMPNIMTPAQAIIQIFCSLCPLWINCLSLKRGIIQSNIHRILRENNHIIYIMNSNCVPDIMILAQAVLQVLCKQVSIGLQCKSRKRGLTPQHHVRTRKKIWVFTCLFYV